MNNMEQQQTITFVGKSVEDYLNLLDSNDATSGTYPTVVLSSENSDNLNYD